MIEIKFPADRPDIAAALGAALTAIGGGDVSERPAAAPPELGAPFEVAPAAAAQPAAEETQAAPQPSAEVDQHGVRKDSTFCATAKDPFYATGKRSGQWKKRQGVSEEDYDQWYAEELDALPAAHEHEHEHEHEEEAQHTDTAAAFAPQTEAPASKPTPQPGVPSSCGEFMGWAAAQQAAGAFTSTDVGAAYATAGIEVSDLFTGTPDEVAQRVATLYGILSSKLAG